ncbi:unnamed protein product [Periconia digitata]|uniref:Uncharacterized protein n=1 Tax=Periconia digitata TaxID=1303443 RepID=A0A9W4U6F7_9PLEO|nr:unnamed protein product [Periconia digitata]
MFSFFPKCDYSEFRMLELDSLDCSGSLRLLYEANMTTVNESVSNSVDNTSSFYVQANNTFSLNIVFMQVSIGDRYHTFHHAWANMWRSGGAWSLSIVEYISRI